MKIGIAVHPNFKIEVLREKCEPIIVVSSTNSELLWDPDITQEIS